jgi:hypothetical protein
MSNDDLGSADVEQVILTGKIVRKFTRDLRGTRYEVLDDTTDGRRAYVVCRFLSSGALPVITAYAE